MALRLLVRIRDHAGSGVFMVCRPVGRSGLGPTETRQEAGPRIAVVERTNRPDFVCDDPALRSALDGGEKGGLHPGFARLGRDKLADRCCNPARLAAGPRRRALKS